MKNIINSKGLSPKLRRGLPFKNISCCACESEVFGRGRRATRVMLAQCNLALANNMKLHCGLWAVLRSVALSSLVIETVIIQFNSCFPSIVELYSLTHGRCFFVYE